MIVVDKWVLLRILTWFTFMRTQRRMRWLPSRILCWVSAWNVNEYFLTHLLFWMILISQSFQTLFWSHNLFFLDLPVAIEPLLVLQVPLPTQLLLRELFSLLFFLGVFLGLEALLPNGLIVFNPFLLEPVVSLCTVVVFLYVILLLLLQELFLLKFQKLHHKLVLLITVYFLPSH